MSRSRSMGRLSWSRLSAVAVVPMLLTAGACGDDDSAGEASTVSLVEGVEVEVSAIDNTFRPEEIEVAAGTEVLWSNDGRNVHNVLPVEGEAWGVEVDDFEPGDEYRHRFTEPGTYPYYCSLHGTTTAGMIGTVVVTG
ncbi:plastocyanin/azurin family copper-binding protein [Acidimicrobiia bacterium EGI L10123]|uniref:cupredoxin domain-containing protein n=1 Tax=Salinilacustrithrix flava TaxID=2957203 RepID=UPI003D7C2F46|nr:plastocyanin/azurin family copper-binding protein [Acidimicrobiia bacterium EGI L10123]